MFDDEPKFKVGDVVFFLSDANTIISDKITKIVIHRCDTCDYILMDHYARKEHELFASFGEARQETIEIINLTTKNI